jgi:hypothetical protein
MTVQLRSALASVCLFTSGCSWFWPAMVRKDPDAELFHSRFPLAGPMRTDGAICALATVGPDATTLVSRPVPDGDAAQLGDWCAEVAPDPPGLRGRIAQLVEVQGEFGPVRGLLFRVQGARGVLVAFSGLGMPASGWVNERFAELAARRGFATFAPIRDETARPMYFDPRREARRALGGALAIVEHCKIPGRRLAFVGVSMGGMEALLANRAALEAGLATRAAVLDPVLDPSAVTDHLDSFWHSFGTDTMQAYFRRILRGRYGEPKSTSFREMLTRSTEEAETIPSRDAPKVWLCDEDGGAYTVFLSDRDPVLGTAQADFLHAPGCRVRPRRAGVKGHVGLACRLGLFDEMIDACAPAASPEPAAPAVRASGPSARTRAAVRTARG